MTKGPGAYRKDFLLKMYDQMFNDINTHILVVWQSIGVLVGAFAIFALAEKEIVTIDVATALIVLIGGWLIGHLYDASYWYNRNLVIIANIERQFLTERDLAEIHYYFGKHRKKGSMLTHLKIQFALAIGIIAVVVAFHFWTRVLPGFGAPFTALEPLRAFPYATMIPGFIFLRHLRQQRDRSYQEFLANSPGREIETDAVRYGSGHPTE